MTFRRAGDISESRFPVEVPCRVKAQKVDPSWQVMPRFWMKVSWKSLILMGDCTYCVRSMIGFLFLSEFVITDTSPSSFFSSEEVSVCDASSSLLFLDEELLVCNDASSSFLLLAEELLICGKGLKPLLIFPDRNSMVLERL